MIVDVRRLETLYRRGVIDRNLIFDQLVRVYSVQPIGEIVAALSPETLALFRRWIAGFPTSEVVYRLGGPPFSRQELAAIRAIRDWFLEHEPAPCLVGHLPRL